MNKIKSSENIFPIFPLSCWKFFFAAGEKINLQNVHPWGEVNNESETV